MSRGSDYLAESAFCIIFSQYSRENSTYSYEGSDLVCETTMHLWTCWNTYWNGTHSDGMEFVLGRGCHTGDDILATSWNPAPAQHWNIGSAGNVTWVIDGKQNCETACIDRIYTSISLRIQTLVSRVMLP